MKWSDTGGGDFEQPPIGTHMARCVRVIDIGTQRGEWQGKATTRRQCIIAWELPTELMSEGELAGKPFLVSRWVTASLGKKANLRAMLENWRGREFTEDELSGFESKNILGRGCMLSLTATEKGKPKVSGVMALPKGMELPSQVMPSIYFSLDQFDAAVFDSLSEGLRKIIALTPEYVQATKPLGQGPKPAGGFDDMDDDIPF